MIDFVAHDEGDSVGVVVVEGVKAGDEISSWTMPRVRPETSSLTRCSRRSMAA